MATDSIPEIHPVAPGTYGQRPRASLIMVNCQPCHMTAVAGGNLWSLVPQMKNAEIKLGTSYLGTI